MKKFVSNSLLSCALVAIFCAASARAETIFIPAVWITSSDAEAVTDQYCITPEGADTSNSECQQEVETCRAAVKMTMMAKMLNLKSAGECIVASGEADKDPSIYPFGCKDSDTLDAVQEFVQSADASDDFDAKIPNSCKAIENSNGESTPTDSTGGTNDQSPPIDVDAGATSGGCSLKDNGSSSPSVSLLATVCALLLYGLARHRCKKEI